VTSARPVGSVPGGRSPSVARRRSPATAPTPLPQHSGVTRPTAGKPNHRRAWAEALVAAALVACTVGARAPLLDYAFWQDEIATARVIQQPTARAVKAQIVLRESTPPAYYVTAWVAARLGEHFRPEPTPGKWLRLLSLVFAVGTTLVTFGLALRLLPLWAAALSGLLVSLSSELVFQGAQLRAYSMLAFASVAFALVLLRAVERPRTLRLAAVAAVVCVGSLTHYFFLLTVAAGVTWIASCARARAAALSLYGAVAVGLLGLVAWLPSWLNQYRRGGYSTNLPITPHRFAEVVGTLFSAQPLVTDAGTAGRGAIVALVLGSSAALLLHPREGRLFALLVLVPLAATAAVAAAGPLVLNTRNLVSVAPFAAIAIAWACTAVPWRPAGWVAATCIAALIAGSYGATESMTRRLPYETVARQLTSQGLTRGEPIVWFGSWGSHIPVGWYAVQPGVSAPSSSGLVVADPAGFHGRCPAVEVVAWSPRGRRFVEQQQAGILVRSSAYAYGDALRGHRGPEEAVVVRLRWRPGLLGAATAARGTVFRRYDVPSLCL
jgi:hypothetical protein